MEMISDNNPKVKLHAHKNGQVYAAAVRFKTGVGRDIRVAFCWREWQRTSGSYADLVENYVDVAVRKRTFLFAPKVYSEEKKVGQDLWLAYGGSSEEGHQSFDESMKDEKLFSNFDKQSPLRPFVLEARKKVGEAVVEYYKKRAQEQEMQVYRGEKSK